MSVSQELPYVVPLQGGSNFRDLGGYRTADGRQVRRGAVFRSAHLGGLTAALHLHRLGFEVSVHESVRAIQPLGVGINLRPPSDGTISASHLNGADPLAVLAEVIVAGESELGPILLEPLVAAGEPCVASSDCASSACQDAACVEPSCTDGMKNGAETGADSAGHAEADL